MEQSRIDALKKQKLNQFYPVKGTNENSIKQVDLTKRTVQFIGNTYYHVDSDLDILIDGAAKRTIAERGPASTATAKIKHLADHRMDTDKMVGRPSLIEETVMDGKTVIYCESEVFQTPTGDEHLIKYQSGGYDQHSIGFRYVDIEFAEKNSENSDAAGYWDEFFPQLLNPEVAEKFNYFWVVKEIELFEISVVTFGANSLTHVVGVKGSSPQDYLFELTTRLDSLKTEALKGGRGKDYKRVLDMQVRQIKQVMSDIINPKPDLKGSFQRQPDTSTLGLDFSYMLDQIENY